MPDELPSARGAQEKRLHQLAQDWSQGQVSLKEIIGLSGGELYAVATQGYFFFLQGKSEPARLIFEGLVAIDPRNAYYYRALGAIYWRERQAQKAIRQFTYAIRVSPHDVASYIGRAEVYVASKNFDEARDDLQDAIARAGNQDGPLVTKARAILQMLP